MVRLRVAWFGPCWNHIDPCLFPQVAHLSRWPQNKVGHLRLNLGESLGVRRGVLFKKKIIQTMYGKLNTKMNNYLGEKSTGNWSLADLGLYLKCLKGSYQWFLQKNPQCFLIAIWLLLHTYSAKSQPLPALAGARAGGTWSLYFIGSMVHADVLPLMKLQENGFLVCQKVPCCTYYSCLNFNNYLFILKTTVLVSMINDMVTLFLLFTSVTTQAGSRWEAFQS